MNLLIKSSFCRFALSFIFIFTLSCSSDEEDEPAPSPVANFTAASTTIDAGGTVSFTNTSENDESISWTFEGGSPETSISDNVTVTYETPGTYDVSLTATNPQGSDTETKSGFITVVDNAGPSVLDITPSDGSTQVPVDVTIEINFTEPIDINSVTNTSLILSGGGSNSIATRVTVSLSQGLMTIDPDNDLEEGTEYLLRLSGLTDLSGNSMPSDFSATFSTFESTNNALNFDGSNDYVELQGLNTGNSFTIELWVNPSDTDTQAFVGKHTSTGGNIFLFGFYDQGLHMRIGSATFEIINTTFTGNTHLAVSVEKLDAVTSLVKVYKFGQLLWQERFADASNLTGGERDWVLGMDWDSSSETDFFEGSMDEVRFWNTIRSENQIYDNMTKELVGNESGLVAYYDFNNGEAEGSNSGETTLEDLAGSADGSLTNFGLSGSSSNWVLSNAFSTTIQEIGCGQIETFRNGNAPPDYPRTFNGEITLLPDNTFNSAVVAFLSDSYEPPFSIEFDYKISDDDGFSGSSSTNTADGIVCFFNKDITPYENGSTPPSGNKKGFIDGSGYGVAIQPFGTRRIEYWNGGAGNVLRNVSTNLAYTGDNWVHCKINVFANGPDVFLDNSPSAIFSDFTTLNATYNRIGFSSGTGTSDGLHSIRNVTVSKSGTTTEYCFQ